MSKPTIVDNWATVDSSRYRGKGSRGVTGNRKSPLPYWMVECRDGVRCLQTYGGFYVATDIPNVLGVYHTADALSAYPRARNAAYSEFFEKVHGESTAQLLVLFGEMEEAAGMIAKRLLNMCEAVKFIRDTIKGNPNARYLRKLRRGAYQARNTRPVKKKKKRSAAQTTRDVADQFGSWQLEWSFGWAPTVSEILSVSEVFCRVYDMDASKLFGRAGESYSYPSWSVTDNGFTVISQRCTGVRVVNPNHALANALGLINPGTLAELVPFSFLADWAFDYSVWVGSLTDTLGYEISEPYITSFTRGVRVDSPGWPFDPPERTSNYVAVKRELGLIQPYPNLDVVGNLGDSFRRILNAASLLAVLTKGW